MKATVDKKQLREAIVIATQHVDSESSRYALGSVLMVVEGETLRLVATDGRELITAVIPAKDAVAGETLIDAKQLKAFKSSGSKTPATVAADVAAWTIATEETTLTGKPTEGRFPRWRMVFPSSPAEATVEATRADIAAMFAEPPWAREISVSGDGVEATSTPFKKEADWFAHGNSRVALCPDYCRGLLAHWTDKELITWEIRGQNIPVVFKSHPARNVQINAALMPMGMEGNR